MRSYLPVFFRVFLGLSSARPRFVEGDVVTGALPDPLAPAEGLLVGAVVGFGFFVVIGVWRGGVLLPCRTLERAGDEGGDEGRDEGETDFLVVAPDRLEGVAGATRGGVADGVAAGVPGVVRAFGRGSTGGLLGVVRVFGRG
ncbi:MAG: hypothetical protein JXQ73_29070 [Phycisphaerae bacterium]|nr:hypothetical protein [Phycisphaerae bacterium]